MSTFWGTIENPEHVSFRVVYLLLGIVNLCTKLDEVFSFKLKNPGSGPKL